MLKRRATSFRRPPAHGEAEPGPAIIKRRAQQSVCPSDVVPATGGLRNFGPRSHATENVQEMELRSRSDVATVQAAIGGFPTLGRRTQAPKNEQQMVVRLRSDVATAQPATAGRATFGRRTQAASIGRQMNRKLRRSRAASSPQSVVGRHLQEFMSLHPNPAIGGRLVPATGGSDPDPATVDRLVLGRAHCFPNPIRMGCLCSGMKTSHWCISDLQHSVEEVFWCERDPIARKFILANLPANVTGFHDLMSNEFQEHAPTCDLLLAGFPCQPFSIQGRGQGLEDEAGRGIVIVGILRYVKNNTCLEL